MGREACASDTCLGSLPTIQTAEGRIKPHQLGRWHVIDPLAELYVGYSPYNYVLNNPISYLDPTGLGVEGWYMDENGQMQFNTNVHSQRDMNALGIGGTYMFEEGYWA